MSEEDETLEFTEVDRGEMVAASGWCAPTPALYDLLSVPEIGISRGGVPAYEYTPPPPLTRRERVVKRWRARRDRLRAVRYAMRKAWQYPEGWWEVD